MISGMMRWMKYHLGGNGLGMDVPVFIVEAVLTTLTSSCASSMSLSLSLM